jgi:DNA-binding MarR family transcriptional regulator
MSRTQQIAEEVAAIMPEIARRVLLGFFQSVDITQTQIFTIMAIHEQTPIRLSVLSRKLHIAAPTVTGIIDRLERSGYVKRTPDPQDRRAVHVGLTPRGQRVAKKLKTTIQKKWLSLLARLPEADQEHYVRILRKVQRGMK